MTPPSPAPPAILAYLTLANKLSVSWDTIHYMKPPTATPPSLAPGASSAEWHAEWTRGLHLADTTKPLGAAFSGAFVPGSLEGTWEGLFTVRQVPKFSVENVTNRPHCSTRSSRHTLPCCPGHPQPSSSVVWSHIILIFGNSGSTTFTRLTSPVRRKYDRYHLETLSEATCPIAVITLRALTA